MIARTLGGSSGTDFRTGASRCVWVRLAKIFVEWQLGRTRNPTRIDYVRNTSFHFRRDELAELYARNPVWTSVERRLYGSTLDELAKDAQARQAAAS